MSERAIRLREAVVERALAGEGTATRDARRAAFENHDVDPRARALVDTVARRAWTVTDDDVARTKAAGLSEDEIFELVICAALGQSTRQLTSALAALDRAAPAAPASDSAQAVEGGRA